MFVLVTVFCVWLGFELNQVRLRKSLIAKIRAAGGQVYYYDHQSWRSRYLRDYEPESLAFQKDFAESHYDLLVQTRKTFPTIGLIETWRSDYGGGARLYPGKDDEFVFKVR